MKRNGQYSRHSFDSLRKQIQNYTYSTYDKLGSGYSSEVFKGRDVRNGKIVAIKVVNLHRVREKGQENLLMREIRLLQEVKHPNLVSCLGAFMSNNNCYIVTDYCAEGDLRSFLVKKGRLGVDEGLKLALEIVAAVCFLHQNGIIHRDIKPQNILLHRNRPKLADFGFAIRCETWVKDGYKIGSPLYMSPEALDDKEYSKKSDVWSLGVTLYQILQGRAPWPAKDEKELKDDIKGEIEFNQLKHPELQTVIKGCLCYDKDSRLTTQEVMIRLEKAMGLGARIVLQMKENKENIERGNQMNNDQQSEQQKKSVRSNYNILKWMINYSRFTAKLLPKIQESDIEGQLRQPFIELTARCLHMTISKLKRIDQFHADLGLINYDNFKRTAKFQKIKTVTAEYHNKHLVLLAKLPYRYSLSNSMALQLPHGILQALQNNSFDKEPMRKEQVSLIGELLTLIEAVVWARSNSVWQLCQLINFEHIIDEIGFEYNQQAIFKLSRRRQCLIMELKRKQTAKP